MLYVVFSLLIIQGKIAKISVDCSCVCITEHFELVQPHEDDEEIVCFSEPNSPGTHTLKRRLKKKKKHERVCFFRVINSMAWMPAVLSNQKVKTVKQFNKTKTYQNKEAH